MEINARPGRGESCPHCLADLKVCLNCRFYSESTYNGCSEPSADRVLQKDKANYCEYFEFRDSSRDSTNENDLQKLKDLFKN